jgi:hypothetical protein
MSEKYTEEQYAEAFRKKMQQQGFTSDDHIDVDPSVIVCDSGAHVQVWLWISNDEVEEMGFKVERGDGDCGDCKHWSCLPTDAAAHCDNDDSPHHSKQTLYTDSCPEYEENDDDTEDEFEEAGRLTDSAMADAEEE